MSANNQHTCPLGTDNECNNEECLYSCIDKELTWKTQEEYDALPENTLILSQLSMFNPRLEKFDTVPILHTKKCLTIATQDYKDYVEETNDVIMVENIYEDIKKYNVKSAENITSVASRPSEKYAKWRKWITQYIVNKLVQGRVMKGVVLNRNKYYRFMVANGPYTIMMSNDENNLCLMTTAHYFGFLGMEDGKPIFCKGGMP